MVTDKAHAALVKKEANLRAKHNALKKGKGKKSRRSRPSIFGWLAFVVMPLVWFLNGIPNVNSGFAFTTGKFAFKLREGVRALILAYSGFDFINMSWNGMHALYGWLPIGIKYAVNKVRVNRMVPSGAPAIL